MEWRLIMKPPLGMASPLSLTVHSKVTEEKRDGRCRGKKRHRLSLQDSVVHQLSISFVRKVNR